MDAEGYDESPFASHSLWRESAFSLPKTPPPNLFLAADPELIEQANNPLLAVLSDDITRVDLELRLPSLDSFQFGKLDDLSPPETNDTDASSASGSRGHQERLEDDDLWQLSLSLPLEGPKLRTWEGFGAEENGLEHEERSAVYISEGGAKAFDAALHRQARGEGAGDVLQSAFFLRCLALLGEGRSSVLFQWGRDGSFTQTLERVRLSGFSLAAAHSVIEELGEVGKAFVELRGFVDKTYGGKAPLSARIALARCVQVVLEALEQALASEVSTAKSVLQLAGCFKAPYVVLQEMQQLVLVSNAARSNTQVMKAIYEEVQHLARACSPHHRTHSDILDRVSHPWVRDVSKKVGLLPRIDAACHDTVQSENDDLGGLLSSSDSRRIDELGASLVILQESCADHPVLNSAAWGIEQPRLEDSSACVDAEYLLGRAEKYESDLMDAIRKFGSGPKPTTIIGIEVDPNVDTECMAWEDHDQQEEYFATIGRRFQQIPGHNLALSDSRQDDVRIMVTIAVGSIHSADQPVDESKTADLAELRYDRSPLRPLRPFLQAQSRLLNGTVLRLLFRQHNFRDHLRLQHSYHLFGNGIFTQRLSTALFSADSSSAERRKGEVIGGSGGNLGLRLDARSKWPPGGSELRLALMGILSESFWTHSPGTTMEDRQRQGSDLPGGLSFAIRELEDEEIERILDPHSIFALDFLRLSYEAPKPLDEVFTAESMEKYDEVFRFILRLIRMIHVTTGLKTLATPTYNKQGTGVKALALEAYHFVSNLAGYIFDVGLGVPWMKLNDKLNTLEADLAAEDKEGMYGGRVKMGLEGLKWLHEGMLDSIRIRLLLRQKQARLRGVLNNIFLRILDVWRRVQTDEQKQYTAVSREDVLGLRGDVKNFLGMLGDLSRKANRRVVTGKATEEKNDLEAVDMLRVRIDLNGFYSKREGELLP